MSFQVTRKTDLVYLTSSSGSPTLFIGIKTKTNQYSFNIADGHPLANNLFKETLSLVDFTWKHVNEISYYSFRTLEDMATFCTTLHWKGLMKHEVFVHLKPFFDSVEKTTEIWGKTFQLAQLQDAEEAPESELVQTLGLYLDTDRMEFFYQWLRMIAHEKSPRKCLGALFMQFRKAHRQLPEEALVAMWKSYGDLLLKIEQKTHVTFLIDLLQISNGFMSVELVKAIFSQDMKDLREKEVQCLMEQVQKHSHHELEIIELVPYLVEKASMKELLKHIALFEVFFSSNQPNATQLWITLQKRLNPEPVSAQSLQLQSILYAYIPPEERCKAVKAYEAWLDKLFRFVINQELGPIAASVIVEIENFKKQYFPQFTPNLRRTFEFNITGEQEEMMVQMLSVESILLFTIAGVVNALRISKINTDENQVQTLFLSLWSTCVNKFKMLDGSRIRLHFLNVSEPQLYQKFIEKLTQLRPKNMNAAFFVMGFVRCHLNLFINKFPGEVKVIGQLMERVALMRMPKRELLQDLHQQFIQLMIKRNIDHLNNQKIDPLDVYKLSVLAGIETKWSVNKKASYRLESRLKEFISSLLNNGSFYHLYCAEEFMLSLHCTNRVKDPLSSSVSGRMETFLDELKSTPANITHVLAACPGFVKRIFEKFEELPFDREHWQLVSKDLIRQMEDAEDLMMFDEAFFNATTFLHLLEGRGKDPLGITVARKIHLTLYRLFVHYWGLYDQAPEYTKEWLQMFSLSSREILSNTYLTSWLKHSDFPSDLLWRLYQLHHDVYMKAVTQKRWRFEFLTSFILFSPFCSRIIEDQARFLTFHVEVIQKLKTLLPEIEFNQYVEALKEFIMKEADQEEESEESLNALNLLNHLHILLMLS
jgi:hypothetical protein